MEVEVQDGDVASDYTEDADQACPGVGVLLLLFNPKFVRLIFNTTRLVLIAEHTGGRNPGAQDLTVECRNSLSTVAMVLCIDMKVVMSVVLTPPGWLGKNLRLLVMMNNMSYPGAVIIT